MRVVLGDGLRLAIGTLTSMPVRPPRRIDHRTASAAMLLAPVATAPLAALAGGVLWLAGQLGVPPWPAATVAVATTALSTRGLHLDGLADTVDGLASTGNRDHALTLMQRGDIGPSGATALLLTVLAQVASLAHLADSPAPTDPAISYLTALIVSRSLLSFACARGIPAARDTGLGATVAGTVPRSAMAVALAAAAILAYLTLGWGGLAGTAIAIVITGTLLVRCVRRLGGVTGDVLGAVIEIATAAFLVTIASSTG